MEKGKKKREAERTRKEIGSPGGEVKDAGGRTPQTVVFAS